MNTNEAGSDLRVFAVLLIAAAAIARAASPEFDLSAIPVYRPNQHVSGVIRNYGNGYAGVLQKWEDGFRKIQPDVSFHDTLPTSDAAFPGLITGQADLAPDGSEPALTETLAFFEVYGYHATPVIVGTGTYDTEGRSPGVVVLVNQDNPLTQLTVEQLDDIFGAERTGGLHGFQWDPRDARGSEKNIRTWGELGLTGEWAGQPIQTYGHAPSGASRFFEWTVLHNSDKWNPNYRGYVESGSKMIADSDRAEQRNGIRFMLEHELAHDRYGIAWTIMPQARGIAGVKVVALAAAAHDPFVLPSRKSFQQRTYPLARNIYIYVNRKPGTPVDPKLREFLRYVLSRDGQQVLADDGGFLPLTAEMAAEQRKTLE